MTPVRGLRFPHSIMRSHRLLSILALVASLVVHPTDSGAAAPARVLARRPVPAPVAGGITAWRPALAVLPFTDRTEGAWLLWTGRDIGEGFARMLADSLACSGDWRLPDTTRVIQAFAARQRQNLVSDANASSLGSSLGAELALCGVVSEFSVTETQPDPRAMRWGMGGGRRRTTAKVVVELRLLDCATGAVVRTSVIRREQVSQSSSSAGDDRIERSAFENTPLGRATREVLESSVRVLEEELVSRMSVRVAGVSAAAVWLDAGRARGLTPGQRLLVMRPELITLDPADGTATPQTERIAAELLVTGYVDVSGRQARCYLQRGRVEPGDIVRLVTPGAEAR